MLNATKLAVKSVLVFAKLRMLLYRILTKGDKTGFDLSLRKRKSERNFLNWLILENEH